MSKSFFACGCGQSNCVFEKALGNAWSLQDKLQIEIDDLELSLKVFRSCQAVGIRIVRDFIPKSEEELSHDKFNHQSIGEIKKALKKLDLSLGMKLPE